MSACNKKIRAFTSPLAQPPSIPPAHRPNPQALTPPLMRIPQHPYTLTNQQIASKWCAPKRCLHRIKFANECFLVPSSSASLLHLFLTRKWVLQKRRDSCAAAPKVHLPHPALREVIPHYLGASGRAVKGSAQGKASHLSPAMHPLMKRTNQTDSK